MTDHSTTDRLRAIAKGPALDLPTVHEPEDRQMTRIYIAGPMYGLPASNSPAFHARAAQLRALGYHVENPAENKPGDDWEWLDYMRAALAQLITCDCVEMLPGWGTSLGATIEYDLAKSLGLPVVGAPE